MVIQIESIYYLKRFSFEWRKVIGFASTDLHRIGLKISRRISNQSEGKPKPMATLSHPFPRALRPLNGITWSFDWFTVLSVPFVIG